MQSGRKGNHPTGWESAEPDLRLAVVHPVPLSRLTPGTVVWAHVDFREIDGWKTRPCVVVERRGREVVLLPGTTSERRHDLRDHVELDDLAGAGLPKNTGVCARPVVVDRIDLVSISGSLSDADLLRLEQVRAEFSVAS